MIITNPQDLVNAIRRARNASSDQMQQGMNAAAGSGSQALAGLFQGLRQQKQDEQDAAKNKLVMSGEELRQRLEQERNSRDASAQALDFQQRQMQMGNANEAAKREAETHGLDVKAKQQNIDAGGAELRDRARKGALERAAADVQANLDANGPKANPDDVYDALPQEVKAAGVSLADVRAKHGEIARAFAADAAARGDKDRALAMQEAARREEERHNKQLEALQWSAQKQARELAGEKADAATAKAADKKAGDQAALNTALSLVNRIQKNAPKVIGLKSGLSATLKEAGDTAHGLPGAAMNVAGNMLSSPDQAKLETDIADFVEHSVNALEQTKRSVSKEQGKLVKGELLGAIRSGRLDLFNAKMEELQQLLEAEKAERGGGPGAPSTSTTVPESAAGAATVPPGSDRPRPPPRWR